MTSITKGNRFGALFKGDSKLICNPLAYIKFLFNVIKVKKIKKIKYADTHTAAADCLISIGPKLVHKRVRMF